MPSNLKDWLELLEFRHHKAIDLGLDRCREVWQRMGSPRPAERVFVVAGTNGKGSTVATICGLLDSLGYRFGSYTTPHIQTYNERVQVQRENVSDQQLIDVFERVEAARGDVSLSYFEFGTLAAFELLASLHLDFAVMEIGLGGRLDAVNLLDADCAVITPIGLDHQEYLGEDLESIGFEKAGIIRHRRPLIIGDADPPQSILKAAARLESPTWRIGEDFSVEATEQGMTFRYGEQVLELPAPALPGPHQYGNAATGLAAVLQMLPGAVQRRQALSEGLRSVNLPGRFQKMLESPGLWLDVGHNALGAAAIAATLTSLLETGEFDQLHCVLAMLADKDAGAVAVELGPVVSHWYAAGLQGERGQTAAQMTQCIRSTVPEAAFTLHESVGNALQAAIDAASPGDGILAFGSFFTVADAMEWLAERASTTDQLGC